MASIFDRFLRRKPPVDQAPKGDSGRGHYGGFLQLEEFNAQLQGKAGLRIFDQMYRSDPDIKKAVWMAVSPLLGATWSVDPAGGDEATDQDKEIANDVAWSLGLGDEADDCPMPGGLLDHLAQHAPVVIRSGFCPSEITWTRATAPSGKDVLTARRFGLRLPRSIERWLDDGHDELVALEQFSQRKGQLLILDRGDLLYYRVGAEGDNWEGTSLLRPVYKPWKIKDTVEKLDAIGQEREAIGLPILYPPAGKAQDAATLASLDAQLEALRNGELAWLRMPGPKQEYDNDVGWAVDIVGVNGQAASKRDPISTLNYHKDAIAGAFMQEFMRLGQGQGGSKGALSTAEAQDDPFQQALQSLADIFRLEIQGRYIRRFVALNFGPDVKAPRLKMSLTEGDLASLQEYVAALVGAGAMFADDPLEDFLRARGNLPPADKAARDERKVHEQESKQAELDAAKAGAIPQPGANGSEKTTTKQRLPAGGERVKETVKHLEDTHDAAALQITEPLVGEKCEHCGKHHDEDDDCQKTLADVQARRALRPWEQHMPLDQLARTLDGARDALQTAAQAHVAAFAAEAVRITLQGQDVPSEPPAALVDAIAVELRHVRATGHAAVGAELAAQRTGHPAHLVLHQVVALAGDLPDEPVQKRAWLAAKAIVHAIAQVAGRRILQGVEPATAQADAATAGQKAARAQAVAHASGALNDGRQEAGQLYQGSIKGARYTSILDENRCEPCAHADDDVLRPLTDPWWTLHGPPNPECYGWDRCRCMRFYQLDDEAPANLSVDHFESWILYDPDQPRAADGKWTPSPIPHPDLTKRVKNLGGSTGAQLREDSKGRQYVTKRGGHQQHLLEEDAADRVYRAAGVPVPDSRVHPTTVGPIKVARYLKGAKPLADLRGPERDAAHEQLRQHFALDATLANWDVVGLEADNVLVTKDGTAVRADNGGALRYRAQGQPKTHVSPYPTELWTLRDSWQGQPVFGSLTWPEIVDQARGVLAQRKQLVDALPGAGQREFLRARLDGLQHVVQLHDQGKTETEIRHEILRSGGPHAPKTLEAGDAPDRFWTLVDAVADEQFTLAADFDPAEHPRDRKGRFATKVGGHALEVIQALAGKYTGSAATNEAHPDVAGALSHVHTTETVAKNKKVGGTHTVKKHTLHLTEQAIPELKKAAEMALAYKAYNKHSANGSSAKQGLERLLKELDKAQKAADYHAGGGTPHQAQHGTPAIPGGFTVGDKVKKVDPNGGEGVMTYTVIGYGDLGTVAIQAPGPASMGGGAVHHIPAENLKLTGAISAPAPTPTVLPDGFPSHFTASGGSVFKLEPTDDPEHVTIVKVSGETGVDIKTVPTATAKKALEGGVWKPVDAPDVDVPDLSALEPELKAGEPTPFAPPAKPAAAGTPDWKPNGLPVGMLAVGSKLKPNDGNGHVTVVSNDGTTVKLQKTNKHGLSGGIYNAEPGWVPPEVDVTTAKPYVPAKPKPAAKGKPKMVEVTGAGMGGKAKVSELDLQPGDMVQPTKGGHIYEVVGPWGGNAVKVKHPKTGKSKVLPGYKPIHKTTAAKKDGSAAPAAAAPAPAKTHLQLVTEAKAGLTPGPPGVTIGQLHQGDVVGTPDGKVLVIEGNDVGGSWVSAHDITTGKQIDPPTGKPPTLYAAKDSPAGKAANEALAKVQTAQASTPGSPAKPKKAAPAQPKVSKTGALDQWQGLKNGQASKTALASWQAGVHSNLDSDQKAAISGYTDGSYGSLNGSLRDDTLKASQLGEVQALDAAFDLMPALPEDIITHRGTHEGALTGTLAPGMVIHDKGFMSTSPTKPWDKDVILHIRLKKGSKVMWGPATKADVTAGEDEIILRRSTMMHVLHVEQAGGTKHVYVEAYA